MLHIPKAELRDFIGGTMRRLTKSLQKDGPKALRFAVGQPETPPVGDDLLIQVLTESLFSRTMDPALTESDWALLGAEVSVEGVVYKHDLHPASFMAPLPGLYVAGPTVYTRRPSAGARCVPVGIAFPRPGAQGPLLLRPSDGAAWELAKHHAVQAAFYTGLYGTHPLVHFPVDAINALTKVVLPVNHVVARLLLPHFYTQLSLNFSVMFIDKSPLHNDQSLPFAGFANDGPRSALNMTQEVYAGMPDHPGYPGYTWDAEPAKMHSDYGAFLEGYHRIILAFVIEVLADVDRSDPDLRRWWRECGAHVRGFPGLEVLATPGELEAAVAFVIWNAAIVHSVDHYSFGTLPLVPHLLRLRVPPPTSRTIPPLDRTQFTTVEDRFRMFFTHRMHIRPNTARKLVDVDYTFASPERQAAQARFIAALRVVDADPGVTRHAPLEDIATSIQY